MGRIITVRNTSACNQGCSFCTFRDSDGGMMPSETVIENMRSGRGGGARVVRFSGGEPFMDRRFPSFVKAARQLGFEEIEVESNGTLLSRSGTAERLAKWGVTRLWLALMHPDDEVNDQLSRAPGTAELSWETLRTMGAQLPIGLSVAVTPDNADCLDRLVERALQLNSHVDRLRFNLVTEAFKGPVKTTIEPGLKKACARARKHKLEFRLESSFAPPPCVFSEDFLRRQLPLYGSYRGDVKSVYGDRVRHEGCVECGFRERCPGIQPHLIPQEIPLMGLTETLTREMKGHLGGEGRSQNTQSSSVELLQRHPGENQKINLRVNWACNQRCRFCWVDFDWSPPTAETVMTQIEEAARAGHTWVVFTGGEPTLVSWLPQVIDKARESGFPMIQIQSNGVHLANERMRSKLVESGLTHALISLHGASPSVSDGITQAPGTFDRTLEGIDGLVKDGVQVSLSHVLTSKNIHETKAFATLVGERWKGAVQVVWSVAAPITEATDRYDDGLLSFDQVSKPLLKGLETCLELGVGFGGQNDTCGVPPCVLNDDPRFVTSIEDAHRDAERDFFFPEVCADCTMRTRCRGVRKGYVERFGTQGLHPRK